MFALIRTLTTRAGQRRYLLCRCWALLLVAGCAYQPDVSLQYFLPKVQIELTVIQTAACTDGGRPYVTSDLLVSSAATADEEAAFEISLRELSSWHTSGEIKLSLYPDGRLRGLNTSQTGGGVEVLKSASQLTQMVTTGAPHPQCAALNGISDKPVSIRHTASIREFQSGPNNTVSFVQETLPSGLFSEVDGLYGKDILASYSLESGKGFCSSGCPEAGAPDFQSGTGILLKIPAKATFTVKAGPASQTRSFQIVVPVPQKGTQTRVPIPKPALFGSNRFELVLDESGRVTSIAYGRDTALADAVGAFSELSDSLSGPTAAERAASINAEADLIAAQQRLVRCQTAPEDCT